MASFWGEVLGTAILLFIGGSVCAGVNLKKSFSYNMGWLPIQIAWGPNCHLHFGNNKENDYTIRPVRIRVM